MSSKKIADEMRQDLKRFMVKIRKGIIKLDSSHKKNQSVLLVALTKIKNGHNNPRQLAEDVLNKFNT